MDRQPLTDRLGDRLLAEYGGAAAAYSLRALNGNGDSVVRVRRESDNDEKDFTAEQIELGEIVNWVNEQITPPLDLRELTATGRDGPIIEAAAAYSLRNLSDSYTGSVVEVRRSSDAAVRSFTATEVADGTLEDWVNTPTNGVFANNGYESFSGASASGFTASNSSSVGFAVSEILNGVQGDIVKVSFDISVNSGSPAISLRAALSGDGSGSNPFIITSSGSYTVTLTATNNYVGVGFTEGDFPSEFTVSNFKVVVDGTVSKWYDQSTTSGVPNANHAVQTDAAKQPKIVDGGSLVVGGLDFDGVADVLETSLVPPNVATLIGVANWDTINNFMPIIGARDSTNARSYIAQTSSNFAALGAATSALSGPNVVAGDDYLLFGIYSGSTRLLSTNGSVVSDSSGSSPNNTTQGYTIGAFNDAGNIGSNLNGTIQEVIVYASDQSDNRTALEANIGEVYGISGIPAYDDTVNGFVETWYDQSGNGNDATQSVAGNQPKIVNAGVLVSGGIEFDGVDDGLYVSGQVLTSSSFYATSVMQHATGTSTSSGQNIFGQYQIGVSGRFQLSANVSNEYSFFANATNSISGFGTGAIGTSQTIISVNGDGSNAEIWRDGTSKAIDTYSGFTPAALDFTIGIASGASAFNGKITEIIVYPSDQSANHAAIEANINNQYDIY